MNKKKSYSSFFFVVWARQPVFERANVVTNHERQSLLGFSCRSASDTQLLFSVQNTTAVTVQHRGVTSELNMQKVDHY